MKRLVTALGFSLIALSASAVELGAPFEQLKLDRALPNIDFSPVEPNSGDSRSPFEQSRLNSALPTLSSGNVQYAESEVGATRTDASGGTEAPTESPFANDHNFITPPQ